jgi:hypothetical protein
MELQSELFKNDKKLNACLVDDYSHVMLGAAGDHVGKIQTALTRLDFATIDAGELATKRYGPSTAAAVLAYKTKRKIVNTSYQSSPDSIVGKMTIKAMDKEWRERMLSFFPVDINPPSKDSVPDVSEHLSPVSTHFQIRPLGGANLSGVKGIGEVVILDLMRFQIWDHENKLIQNYVYGGLGPGVGLTGVVAGLAKFTGRAKTVAELVGFATPTAPGPFTEFLTIKPVAVGIFNGPAHWTSLGGGPWTMNILQIFFVGGLGGPEIKVNTGFTLGLSISSSFGVLAATSDPRPFESD